MRPPARPPKLFAILACGECGLEAICDPEPPHSRMNGKACDECERGVFALVGVFTWAQLDARIDAQAEAHYAAEAAARRGGGAPE